MDFLDIFDLLSFLRLRTWVSILLLTVIPVIIFGALNYGTINQTQAAIYVALSILSGITLGIWSYRTRDQ